MFNILESLMHYKAYFNDFSTQKCILKGINSCLRQHFILFKLTGVKMYRINLNILYMTLLKSDPW